MINYKKIIFKIMEKEITEKTKSCDGFTTAEDCRKVADLNNFLLKEYYSGDYSDIESIPHFMNRRKQDISIERLTSNIKREIESFLYNSLKPREE